jgi:hypothetical protein
MTAFKSAISANLLVGAFATLVATSPIAAQPAAEGRGPGMMGDATGTPMLRMMGQDGMMPMMGMGDHVEGRIAFLKTELKITDAQTPQWNAFADSLRANAERMKEMRNTMMQGGMMDQGGASVSAPDRLNRMEKMMTGMLESVKATKAALAPLYAVLTDEQKKMADQLIHGTMGMGRM